MYFFDLHCDTITRLYKGERLAPGENSLRRNGAHIDLERMRGLRWCQCFAIFMPDEYRGKAAADYFEENFRFFREQLAANSDLIVQVRTATEIENALAEGRAAALLTVEGGSALTGDLGRVKLLADCGVRVLTLTWNGANALAGGCGEPGGLTPFGRAALAEMERASIVADVSHLSDQAFWELEALARRPFIATHSNSRAMHAHRRNLTDEQFCCIVRRGGLVGINFYVKFLSEKPDAAFADMAAHIAHFLELGGENTLALGSDYDGSEVPSWLDPAEKIKDLYPLVAAEFGSALAEKLFFTNALDFFRRYENL